MESGKQSEFSKKIMQGMEESNRKFYERMSKINVTVVIMENGKIKKVKAKKIWNKYYSPNKKT